MATHRQMNYRTGIFQLLGISLLFMLSCKEKSLPPPRVTAPFLHTEVAWQDSMLFELSLEEKLGQLLYWQGEFTEKDELVSWVDQGLIGGVQLPGFDLDAYIDLTDSLRDICRLPLFFGTEEPAVIFNHFDDLPVFLSQ